ncbi:MAG TPA: glycosyltransferase [Tepidisphaeraceae bacterium]|nr:glycosyltransferase [Tepidisphaeraceae bacterium]
MPPPRLAIIAIGRNEGDRLRRCLESARGRGERVIYVDSGSTDGSVKLARELGATVVELDMSRPFTAARARNEGLAALAGDGATIDFVQLVDGDCEIVAGWLDHAAAELAADEKLAAVCGRRRERHPDASPFNKLADIEWDTPVGDAKACGGDAMFRLAPLRESGGFDATVIAGEEPELCVRLRRDGWKIRRIDAEMTLHDAAMTRFGQWWRRMVRGGHAYAQGYAMHGRPPERHWASENRRIVFWGIAVPLLVLLLAWPTRGISLVLLGGYLVLYRRVLRHARSRGLSPADARLYARHMVIGKFAEAQGWLKYWLTRLVGGQSRIIEYKLAAPAPDPAPAPAPAPAAAPPSSAVQVNSHG